VIGGWVGDRFGPRKTLFWCGMIWAASTIMTGFVNSLLTLFIARVALGFGEAQPFRPRRAPCNTGRLRASAASPGHHPRLRPAGQRHARRR